MSHIDKKIDVKKAKEKAKIPARPASGRQSKRGDDTKSVKLQKKKDLVKEFDELS